MKSYTEKLINDWKKNAQKLENQNFYFIRKLKFKNANKVDRIAQSLHQETFEKIDCTQCANCCKHTHPLFTQKDIERVAKHVGLSEEEFKKQYWELDRGEYYTKELPCVFLSDNRCSIYEIRPEACQSYPFTHKKDFATRSHVHSANTLICPAVFHIVERMKQSFR